MTDRDRPAIHLAFVDSYRPNGNPFYQFWMGLRFGWSGLCLLVKSPRLQVLSAVPVLLTGGSFAGFVWFGVTEVRQAIDAWVASLPHWLGAIAEIAGSAVAAIALLLIAYAIFIPLLGIVAGPFRDAMSMHTERLLRGKSTDDGLGLLQSLVQISLLLGFQIGILVLLVGMSIAAPGIGTLLSVAIAIYMTTLDMVDPALGLRGYPFARKLQFVRQHTALLAGFGVISWCVFLIPLLNIAILPIATIGGTLLVMAVTENSPSNTPTTESKD